MTIQEDSLHCSTWWEVASERSPGRNERERGTESSGGGGGGGGAYWSPPGFYFILTEMSQQRRTDLQVDVFHSSHASEKEQEWGNSGKCRGSVISGAEQWKRLRT
jgi:hypothetical protein